jgi:hypothetical protein
LQAVVGSMLSVKGRPRWKFFLEIRDRRKDEPKTSRFQQRRKVK